MTPKLPSVPGDRLIRALQKAGFRKVRQKGSHVALERMTESKTFRTIVPLHKSLAKGTLMDILKQSGLTKEQLLRLL